MSSDEAGAVCEPTDTAPPAPTIHEAEPAPGPSGAVWFGPELTFDQAVARRLAGLDVVVRGDDTDANRRMAFQVESVVGPPTRPQKPHNRAGPSALPHYHQLSRNPDGHIFYETDNPARKARRRP
jgi:hypothetical protein